VSCALLDREAEMMTFTGAWERTMTMIIGSSRLTLVSQNRRLSLDIAQHKGQGRPSLQDLSWLLQGDEIFIFLRRFFKSTILRTPVVISQIYKQIFKRNCSALAVMYSFIDSPIVKLIAYLFKLRNQKIVRISLALVRSLDSLLTPNIKQTKNKQTNKQRQC